MQTIQLTIPELQALLDEQKQATADHITRNLSFYAFFELGVTAEIGKKIREQLVNECLGSEYVNDFVVLKKYLKP